jgi:hypothetical protein
VSSFLIALWFDDSFWHRVFLLDCAADMDGSGEIIRAIAASQLGFRYEELRKATDDFNQINKLGQFSIFCFSFLI